MLLADWEIKELVKGENPMIEPFLPRHIRAINRAAGPIKILSMGLGIHGYDVSAQPTVKIARYVEGAVADPKRPDERLWYDAELCEEAGEQFVIIPARTFFLFVTEQYFRMPRTVGALLMGKSSIERNGQACRSTWIEAGWAGHITGEGFNELPIPARFYIEEGCAQLIFFRGQLPDTAYDQRPSNYQGQRGITLPHV